MATKTSSRESALLAKIQELESRIAEITQDKTGSVSLPSDYVRVMSLLPYPLNLSTRERGQGKTFKFTKFGEIKRIIYSDLLDIMEAHRNFLESGFFFIMNPEVVRSNGLEEVYSKILTKEKITAILDGNTDFLELFESCNKDQQQTIITMVSDRLRDRPDSIDMNVVERLSRASKVDIARNVEESLSNLPDAKK